LQNAQDTENRKQELGNRAEASERPGCLANGKERKGTQTNSVAFPLSHKWERGKGGEGHADLYQLPLNMPHAQ
ncbi:hypothetical protein CJ255_17925, partial [Candidatus Viridilinea mediisalina]